MRRIKGMTSSPDRRVEQSPHALLARSDQTIPAQTGASPNALAGRCHLRRKSRPTSNLDSKQDTLVLALSFGGPLG